MSLRTIVLVVLILIAVALVAIIGVRASQIYGLAASSRGGLDLSEVSVEVTEIAEFFNVATFIPLVQAFTGTSFNLEGTTSLPPQTTSVSTSGISLDLTDPLLKNGWTFSQVYDDGDISTTLVEDKAGDRVFIAASEQDDPAQFLSDIEHQYSDMLPLFGFEVVFSTVEADSMETVASKEDLAIEAQAWTAPEDSNKVYVAVLMTTGELSTSSADFDEIVALLLR